MSEFFSRWEWWQIALTAIFGTVWLVFIVLDTKRKIAVKKRRKQREQELRAQGLSDEQIAEYFQQRKHLAYIYSGKQCTGKSIHFTSTDKK